MRDEFDFRVQIETNEQTGEVMAVYLQIRKGQSATVKEYADGAVFADYDKKGRLLGIEILEPCRASVLSSVAATPSAKKFVRDSIPRGMVLAK